MSQETLNWNDFIDNECADDKNCDDSKPTITTEDIFKRIRERIGEKKYQIVKVQKFVLSTFDHNFKYSDEYIKKQLSNLIEQHQKIVAKEYKDGQELTPEVYKQKINEIEERLKQPIIVPDEIKNKYIRRGTWTSVNEHFEIYLIKSEIQKDLFQLQNDYKKTIEFKKKLQTKRNELLAYRYNPNELLERVCKYIINETTNMNSMIINYYYTNISEKIDAVYDDDEKDETKRNKAVKRIINSVINSKDSQKGLKIISDMTNWIGKQLMNWRLIIPKINIDDNIDEKEKCIMTALNRLTTELGTGIVEIIDDRLNLISSNVTFDISAAAANYAKYLMERMNEMFINDLQNQIFRLFCEKVPSSFRVMINRLQQKFKDNFDINPEFMEYENTGYDEDTKALSNLYNDVIVKNGGYSMLELKAPSSSVKVEEIEDETPQQLAITQDTQQQITPIIKTLDGFINTLPNGEMLLDDILTRYNDYFGTNVTKNKISQNKDFMSKFDKDTRKVNRKITNFYKKKDN